MPIDAAPAPAPAAELRLVPPPKKSHELWSHWLARFSAGLGMPVPSPQNDLLRLEGYAAPRWVFAVEAAAFLSEQVALGAFGLSSVRYDDSAYSGPTLREDVYAFGASLPIAVPLRVDTIALFTPRLGVGFGAQSFGPPREHSLGPALGFDASVLLEREHFGFGLGFWSLRVGSRGAAARNDYGSVMLLLNFAAGK